MAEEKAHGFLSSSIGQKSIVAVTGVCLFLFVVVHMLGNLQFFAGPDALNGYAKFLKSVPAVLWGARLGLLTVFALHIFFAVSLTRRNVTARPVGYAYQNTMQASPASRTMALTGSFIAVYVVYHLLHFTLGITDPENFHHLDSLGRHDVHAMVVAGFRNIYVSLFYILAVFVLSFHLSHGIASFFQTLGLASPKHCSKIEKAASVISAVIFVGYVSIPVYVLAVM